MVDKPPRSHTKRPFSEIEDSLKPLMQKKPRFPKGKKVKLGDEAPTARVIGVEERPKDLSDPKVAAEERVRRRTRMFDDLFSQESRGMLHDISVAEVKYQADAAVDDDGVQIEPFNLNQEREEGYFDADGNFVECSNENKPLELIPKRRKKHADENEIKDAWLDSVKVDSRFAGKSVSVANNEEEEEDSEDLSPDDIGKMKRRIADLLEPGETVLQALRRLKGSSNDRKERMSEETKLMFDQLTEDSMKLMENGDYNVYNEKQEVFKREAEGYERLAHARNGTSGSVLSSADGDDEFDMFGDDENPSSDRVDLDSGSVPTSENLNTVAEGGDSQMDYVYDESSGYSYNEQTGTYEEIQGGDVQGTLQDIQGVDAQPVS
ncbi:hypothetical protein GIB67_019370 [Kingdonia uniflora]|uniref:Uncharacterized protein n=1 Tax=Kingdonia uniflora TaxID=39325 RepID=A0A7J7M1P0_9MAGN|nr:hypothetical protein GIB67_019370 [Kingdonia uniflora]